MARVTRPALIPLLIAIGGAAIVLYQWIGARPLWLDEEMIALNFRDRSFAELGGRLWLDQSAPLAWLALQRLVLLVLGPSEIALRAIPALFGVATVFAAFFVGRRWMTTTGCAIFVLLCSLGQWMSFHAVELKSYSADTFWGLWLPALAVAAGTASSTDARRRSLAIWAMAAAIGPWFSLGALLVLPACFVVLAVSERRDREGMQRLALAFTAVIASFALQYVLAIRYTQGSASLQEFWQFAMAPRDAGVVDSLRWVYDRLEPFALKPGGTGLAVSFWICVALGVALATTRLLGLDPVRLRARRGANHAALRTAVDVARSGAVSCGRALCRPRRVVGSAAAADELFDETRERLHHPCIGRDSQRGCRGSRHPGSSGWPACRQ